MMQSQSIEFQQVRLSELQNAPIQITLHSSKSLRKITDAIAKNEKDFGPIKVASFEGKLYVIDGHAIVEGFRSAKLQTIHAVIYHVNSINDVLSLHVRLNQHSPLNPFKLIELIEFMQESGMQPAEIIQKLNLSDHLVRLVGCKISSTKAKLRLEEFIDQLATKYSNVVIPPYFVELLCKIPEKIQLNVVEQFIAIMDLTMSDRKFAFPGPETLDVYFRQYLKNKERDPIFFAHEVQRKDSKNAARHTACEKVSKTDLKEARKIIGTITGMAMLKVKKPGLYRVDMVNKTITPIYTKDNFIVIQGDDGKKIFSLPQNAVDFLDIKDEEDAKDITVKLFSAEQLKKFVANLPSTDKRYVVFYTSNS